MHSPKSSKGKRHFAFFVVYIFAVDLLECFSSAVSVAFYFSNSFNGVNINTVQLTPFQEVSSIMEVARRNHLTREQGSYSWFNELFAVSLCRECTVLPAS